MTDALQTAITRRVDRIRAGRDPQCLARLNSGWVIMAKFQPESIPGGCMLLPDPVVPSLNDLGPAARAAFLGDLATVGDAVLLTTGAEHLNYLILCNQVPELHGHCVPRFESESPEHRAMDPFEAYDFGSARVADALGQDAGLARRLRAALLDLGGALPPEAS